MGFFSNAGKFLQKYGPQAYLKGNMTGDYGDIPFGNQISEFLTGKPGEFKQQSRYGKEQLPLHEQSVQAALGRGAGGAFGDVADYYRNNLSDNPADLAAFAAPELRRFNEEIIPGLSEQFAGMGSGALSSSGFRNAAVNAGTDLSERLGAIRANLRQQAAQGLMGVGQQGLAPAYENIYMQPTEGFLQSAAPAIGTAAGAAFGGPLGAWAGNQLGQKVSNAGNPAKGSTSPYGQQGAFGFSKIGAGF